MIKYLPPHKTHQHYRGSPCGSPTGGYLATVLYAPPPKSSLRSDFRYPPDVMRNRPLNSEEKTDYENQVV